MMEKEKKNTTALARRLNGATDCHSFLEPVFLSDVATGRDIKKGKGVDARAGRQTDRHEVRRAT